MKEARHVLFGRVFAYLSVVRSGRITQTSAATAVIEEMLTELVGLYNKKVYLRPLAVGVMVELVHNIPVSVFKSVMLPRVSSLIEVPPVDASPEAIALIAAVKREFGVCIVVYLQCVMVAGPGAHQALARCICIAS